MLKVGDVKKLRAGLAEGNWVAEGVKELMRDLESRDLRGARSI
jgi:hypothetical protein